MRILGFKVAPLWAGLERSADRRGISERRVAAPFWAGIETSPDCRDCVKTSLRSNRIRSVEHGVSRASGTKSFARKAVPGLQSWAKFRASLRDEDRNCFHTVGHDNLRSPPRMKMLSW